MIYPGIDITQTCYYMNIFEWYTALSCNTSTVIQHHTHFICNSTEFILYKMSQKAKDPKSEDTRLTISFFNYSKWNTIANYETEYVHVECLCVYWD